VTIQERNAELVALLRPDFQGRAESNFAWKRACSAIQALPGLRGFWPCSSMHSGPTINDISGMAGHLNAWPTGNTQIGYEGLIPYVDMVNSFNYSTKTFGDIFGNESFLEAGQEGLTIGGWFYPKDIGSDQFLMAKGQWVAGGFSYALVMDSGDPPGLLVSDDGTNYDSVYQAGLNFNGWNFIVGRYNDANTGAELAINLNGVWNTAATARNSIFDSAGYFSLSGMWIGATYTNPFLGRASLCFLSCFGLENYMIDVLYETTRPLFGL